VQLRVAFAQDGLLIARLVDQQRLVRKGVQLEDGRTLVSYQAIKCGDKVQVVLRLLGS
jgi:hypothetical protein